MAVSREERLYSLEVVDWTVENSVDSRADRAPAQPNHASVLAAGPVAPFLLFSSHGSPRAAHQDSPAHGLGRVAAKRVAGRQDSSWPGRPSHEGGYRTLNVGTMLDLR